VVDSLGLSDRLTAVPNQWIDSILQIIYISPIISPPHPLPHPTYSSCKRFLNSFSYSYMKSIDHITHTDTVLIFQSWFSLLIFKLMFNGVSQYMPTVGILSFGPFNPFHYSSLPFYLPPHSIPFFNSFQNTSLHPLPSHLMLCDSTDALSFSFPFPLSLSSIE
jgi:hypothetical protein